MAVVFISPRSKQKAFLMWIIAGLLVFVAVLSFGVFTYKPQDKTGAMELVFNKTKITLDMSVLEMEKFKELESFDIIKQQFSYKAMTAEKKQASGIIEASTVEEAEKILDGMGLSVIDIQPWEIGRINPFTPFYEQAVPENSPAKETPVPAKKTSTTPVAPVVPKEPEYEMLPDGTIIEVK